LGTRHGRLGGQGVAFFTSKSLQLRSRGEIRQARGDFGGVGFTLTAEFLFHGLGLGHLLAAARGLAFTERLGRFGTTEEAERGATCGESGLAILAGQRIGRGEAGGGRCHFGKVWQFVVSG
jgi:hypothetical protein